jgi:hypothetical protein
MSDRAALLVLRLYAVEDLVGIMELALATGDLTQGRIAADDLVAVTTELLEQIDHDPGHEPETDAEFVATLRVYQNAAFVFRRMSGVTGTPDPAMSSICAAMIEQGHDHLRLLVREATLEKPSDT